MNNISLNMANIITIAIICLLAFAAVNFFEQKTGLQIPYVN